MAALTCFEMFLEVLSVKMKDFTLFKKKIRFVFPLIYAPGPAASVWNFFGRSGKPALLLHWRLWVFQGRLPHTGAPGPEMELESECWGPSACWRTHLRNPLTLALWLAVKVVFVCLWSCSNLDLVQWKWACLKLDFAYRSMFWEKAKVLESGLPMPCFHLYSLRTI